MIRASDLVGKFVYAYGDRWGYIWGATGQIWTQAKQDAATREMTVKYGQKWVGRHVVDCSGMFTWAFKLLGGYMYHGSNTMWNKYCVNQGDLVNGQRSDGAQLLPGTAVFKKKKLSTGLNRHHVGLYIGNGEVIEAKGTQSGVVISKVTDWPEWGELKGVDYSDAGDQETPAEQETEMQGQCVVDVPNDGTVNFRAKPSLSGKVLKQLREGTEVAVVSDDGEWCEVEYTTVTTGYIMSKFLREKGDGSDV